MREPWSKRYSIWRIKSPLLRLPVAWVYCLAAIAVYAVFLVLMVAVGVFYGAKDGFDEWRHEINFPDTGRFMWRAATSWRAV